MNNTDIILKATKTWFEQVVLGLNLCPFAHKPARENSIRFTHNTNQSLLALGDDLLNEMDYLQQHPEIETSIIILSQCLQDFDAYNSFLEQIERLLKVNDYEGVFQVASFHPDYQFADTEPEDAGNLSNRAPYPLLHIIREDRLEQLIKQHPDTDKIPAINIKTLERLSEFEKKQLFPYLYPSN